MTRTVHPTVPLFAADDEGLSVILGVLQTACKLVRNLFYTWIFTA